MRSTSQLSLLLFLNLATSLPIVLPKNCLDSLTCQSHLRIFESKHSALPPTLSPPHFPSHQLTGKQPKEEDDPTDEEPFDNAPITPSAHTSPSTALSGSTPLTSAYLLSLTNPSRHYSTHVDGALPRPSMPTSALPLLRKLDSIRYWANLRTEPEDEVAKLKEIESSAIHSIPISPMAKCHHFLTEASNSAYLRVGKPIRIAKDYSDLLVVEIVVLFLGVVVCVELVQKIVEL
jgi:hypothetical protein